MQLFQFVLNAVLQLYRVYLQVSAAVSVCFYMQPCSCNACTYPSVQLFQFVFTCSPAAVSHVLTSQRSCFSLFLHEALQLYPMYLHVSAAVSVCFTRSPAAVSHVLTRYCSCFSLFYTQPCSCISNTYP